MTAPSAGRRAGWRPVAALAALDGRKLIVHPAFLVGVGFSLIGSANFIRASTAAGRITWDDDAWTVGAGFVVLALFTMIASNIAALRDRREHTVEQHSMLPVPPSQRTAGLLVAGAFPTAASAGLLVMIAGYGATQVPLTAVDRVHLAGLVAVVALMTVLGVALAIWLPSPFIAPLVAWAVVFSTPSDRPRPWQVLTLLAAPRDAALAAWHVAYIAGITIIVATAALARTARGRTIGIGAVVGVASTVISSIVLVSNACPLPGRCRF